MSHKFLQVDRRHDSKTPDWLLLWASQNIYSSWNLTQLLTFRGGLDGGGGVQMGKLGYIWRGQSELNR